MNDTALAIKQLACGREGLLLAIVSETYPPEINGVAMTIGKIVEGLLRRGHHIQLVRPRQHSQDYASTAAQFHEVLMRGIPLPRYYGLRMGLPATAALCRLWQRKRPHIVHVVTEGPLGKSALSAARRLAIPVSSDFHTNFHSYSQHYGFGLLKPVIAGYLRRFHNRAACTFVPTRELQALLASEGYRDLLVVARGVDSALFAPARRSAELRATWGVSELDLVVTYVGRLAPEKNLPLVLSSFDEISRHTPSSRLVLVGDGPQRAELQRRYPRHIFAGMRRGEDLAEHYASGDLFLFPSLTETFGNVTVEAMASGLAVVAYDYAAGREHIRHDETGLLAPFDDARAFTRLASDLALNRAHMAALRRNARLAAELIHWDKVVEHFALAIEGLAERQKLWAA